MSRTKEVLGKNLGFFSVFAIGTGTMIGAGIFVLPSIAITTAGSAAVLSFILGGLITLATTLSVVELSTSMPKAGGSYYFISRSLGPIFGTIIGLGAWISLVFKGSFALVGLAEYLNVFFPLPAMITGATMGLLLIFINYRGAKSSGNFQNVIVVGLILILLAFILKGSTIIDQYFPEPFMPFGISSVFETTGIIFISYLGIVKLAAISEEIKDPDKNIPRAFLGSVIFVILIYTGVILTVSGIVPIEKLLDTKTPLVYATSLMTGPLGSVVITIAGFFATISTANAAILSSSRFPFAMARDDLLPKSFVNIHKKYQTPYRAILVTGITMLVLLILFDVEQLAKLGSTFNVIVFVLVNFSVIVFRKSKDLNHRPSFKDPFFPLTQIVGIGGSLMLLPSLGLFSTVFAVVVVIIGIIWYKLRAGSKIKFEYSIKNYLSEGEVSINIDEEERVLVPIANPDHEDDLLYLADKLGDMIIGLNVVKVPEQTSLSAAKEFYHDDEGQSCKILKNIFDKWSEVSSHKQKYIVAFHHDVSDGIIDQAAVESANLIVLGWKKTNRLQINIGNIAQNVVTNSKSHVAILKGDFVKNPKRIVVAYDGKNNSRYGLALARKLASNTNATLSILRVINPDTEQEEKENIKKHLEEVVESCEDINVEYEIQEKYSEVDTILAMTQDSDLTIIGDSSKKIKNKFLSTLPQMVANHSRKPILIIKRYEPSRRYLGFFE